MTPQRIWNVYGLMLLLCVAGFASSGALGAGETREWPREMTTPSGRVAIYQPQVEMLEGTKLTGRAALSLGVPVSTTAVSAAGTAAEGGLELIFGAVWFEAEIATDRERRTLAIQRIKVTRVKFPERVVAGQIDEVTAVLETEFPKWKLNWSLDQVLADLEVADRERQALEAQNRTPPRILFSDVPAMLIVLDGDPELRAIENSHVMRVVNTPYAIFFEPSSKRYYFDTGDGWVSAPDVVRGPWQDSNPPMPVLAQALPLMAARENAGAAGSGESGTAPPIPTEEVPLVKEIRAKPQILVTTEPAELIVTEGRPRYTPLPGNDLLYVSNTDADVFLDVASQQYFVLLSGRWYTSEALDDSWAYVAGDALPPAFAQIPPDSPKGDVLAHVVGTTQAKEAVAEAEVPDAVGIRRKDAKLDVTYDGEPEFQPVVGQPDVRYAVNTSEAVLLVRGRYYCCHDGVWFVADGAQGPWVLADWIPAEIYRLPPTSPVYRVRYVYVYDSTPEVVYCGYTPGYVGCYTYGGTIFYGTGYRYRPWCGRVYYPRPCTWGFSFRYNSDCGWGVGFRYGGFNLGIGHRVARSCGDGWRGWWGPGGYPQHNFAYRHIHSHDHDWNRNVSSRSWGSDRHDWDGGSGRQWDGDRGQRRSVYDRRNDVVGDRGRGRSVANERSTQGETPRMVMVGRDGQVYRQMEQGWQRRDGNGWTRGEPNVETGGRGSGSDDGRRTARTDREGVSARPQDGRFDPNEAPAAPVQPTASNSGTSPGTGNGTNAWPGRRGDDRSRNERVETRSGGAGESPRTPSATPGPVAPPSPVIVPAPPPAPAPPPTVRSESRTEVRVNDGAGPRTTMPQRETPTNAPTRGSEGRSRGESDSSGSNGTPSGRGDRPATSGTSGTSGSTPRSGPGESRPSSADRSGNSSNSGSGGVWGGDGRSDGSDTRGTPGARYSDGGGRGGSSRGGRR